MDVGQKKGAFAEALRELTGTQVDFICSEFGTTKDELFLKDEDFIGELYDDLCDIEIAEIPVGDDEVESDRCKLASAIVTVLGNAIAEDRGYFDETAE